MKSKNLLKRYFEVSCTNLEMAIIDASGMKSNRGVTCRQIRMGKTSFYHSSLSLIQLVR
jgi:hypothetical protein